MNLRVGRFEFDELHHESLVEMRQRVDSRQLTRIEDLLLENDADRLERLVQQDILVAENDLELRDNDAEKL